MNDHPLTELEALQAEFSSNEDQNKIEYVKSLLSTLASEWKELEQQKKKIEGDLDNIKASIHEVRQKVYQLWLPYLNTVHKAELKFDNCKLTMSPELQVSMDDQDVATEWLAKNGYKDVMKWQIHTQTFKKIGRELYQDEKNPTLIPGVKYEEFKNIKIK